MIGFWLGALVLLVLLTFDEGWGVGGIVGGDGGGGGKGWEDGCEGEGGVFQN